jgi:hypothetical protein
VIAGGVVVKRAGDQNHVARLRLPGLANGGHPCRPFRDKYCSSPARRRG